VIYKEQRAVRAMFSFC